MVHCTYSVVYGEVLAIAYSFEHRRLKFSDTSRICLTGFRHALLQRTKLYTNSTGELGFMLIPSLVNTEQYHTAM